MKSQNTSSVSGGSMKILILCTYPISEPTHGGQLRVRNIVDTYRAHGHQVKVIGVLGSDGYKSEPEFLPFPGYEKLSSVFPNPFLMEDYAIGELFSTDDYYYSKLKEKIDFDVDVVQIEHPWLFRFIKRLMLECSWHPKIIYSSHNVEHLLKKTILLNYISESDANNASELIKSLEVDTINYANGVICVSETDESFLNEVGAKQILLARNGVSDWISNETQNKLATHVSKSMRFTLYCASGHPPNVTGFFDMFGGGFGSLTPDQKLIIAGGAGHAIAGDQRIHESAKLAEKVIVAGVVSKEVLIGLIDTAHCIILPLTQGGGTNLKTAEALWSGKYVLATTVAMRGFESFISSPGVFVEDEPCKFKRKLREIMSMPPLVLASDEVEKRATVLWSNCLNALPFFIEQIAK